MSLESFNSAPPRKKLEDASEVIAPTSQLAEGLDLDPRFTELSQELNEVRKEEGRKHVDDLMATGLTYENRDEYTRIFDPSTFKLDENGNYSAQFADVAPAEVRKVFSERYPEDTKRYEELEKTRIYKNFTEDPAYDAVDRQFNTLADLDDTWHRERNRADAWDEFVVQYPEKAAAYGGEELEAAKQRQADKQKQVDYQEALLQRKAEADLLQQEEVRNNPHIYRPDGTMIPLTEVWNDPNYEAKKREGSQYQKLNARLQPNAKTERGTVKEGVAFIPPQYKGMTAEALDIAWTVPQYADPEKTKQEQQRKAQALTYLQTPEARQQENSAEKEPVPESEQLHQTPEIQSASSPEELGFEKFETQGNVQEAIKMAEKYLSTKNFDERTFQNQIYTFLRRRGWVHGALEQRNTEQLDWMQTDYKPHIEWFNNAKATVEADFEDKGITTADNGVWFSMTASERREGGEASARYKVYETLDTSNYDYIAKLPSLVEKLKVIGEQTGESIKIKTPRSFIGFTTDNDSLVAHCDSEETCLKIQEAIAQWKSENDIKDIPRELGRTKIAIDGKINASDTETSFSDLVANQITNWAKEHKDNYPADVLGREAIKHAILLSQKAPSTAR